MDDSFTTAVSGKPLKTGKEETKRTGPQQSYRTVYCLLKAGGKA